MCLQSGKRLKKYIADENIPIIKVCFDGIYSYYMDFKYELNKKYKLKKHLQQTIEKPFIDFPYSRYCIHEGFYSYDTSCVLVTESKTHCKYASIIYCRRCLTTLYTINSDKPLIKVKGYIPKDTVYYKHNGQYVSESIVLTEYEEIKFN